MDRNKTGDLIAAARKGKNMTQKELAAALHVSDRAVSKWERSAGFPDSHGGGVVYSGDISGDV